MNVSTCRTFKCNSQDCVERKERRNVRGAGFLSTCFHNGLFVGVSSTVSTTCIRVGVRRCFKQVGLGLVSFSEIPLCRMMCVKYFVAIL
jgi:hypothetical protein